MESLIYLNKYLLKYRVKIWKGLLFIVVANISALFPAHLIGKSFDLITVEINNAKSGGLVDYDALYSLLAMYAFLLLFFALLRGLFMFYMRQNIIVASRHIEYDLKNKIYSHYQHLSSNFYKMHDAGDLINRITEDVSKVRMYLGPALMYSLNLIILIVLILYRMFTVSPELTFIVLSPLPVLSFLIYKVSHRINAQSSLVQKQLSTLTNSVQEIISSIRLIKSFVREKIIRKHFNDISEKYMIESIQLSKINSIFFPLILLLVGASIILTVYVGGLLVVDQLITVGQVAEFIIYVNMLTWPVTSIGWVTEVIQRAAASQSRINEFLNTTDYTPFHESSKMKLSNFKFIKSISFLDVSFKYNDSAIFALKSLDFKLKFNAQNIAFVGHVGSGKTTVLQLLTGLLLPSSGKMLFDNLSSKDFRFDLFRHHISYVHQDVFLFSDSIRNNILFGVENIREDELLNVSEKMCILAEIKSFKDGFDTQVGEGGIMLSGGQKQRIALARAIIRQPKLLILDDALSNVDSDTECKIINYIKSELKNTTIVLTSNRLSVLSSCDQIFVLNSGNLVQQGSHEDLMKIEGEYRKLFFNQMLLQ